MRVSFALGVVIAFSLLARARIMPPGVAAGVLLSSLSLGVGYDPGACPRPHHLVIISCGEVGRSCRPRVPLHLIGVLSSHLGRISCGGRRTLPLISPCVSSSLSWGKRRRMGFLANRPLMSPGLLVSRLVLPSRVASRVLFVIVMISRGDGRVLRSCSFLSRRGRGGMSFVCPAAWRSACPHPSPVVSYRLLVVSSRPPSRPSVSFSDVLRAGW